jgi:hypothetical protein
MTSDVDGLDEKRAAVDKRNRNISRTHRQQKQWRQKQFLAELRRLGTDNHAADSVGISTDIVQKWKKTDADFLAEYEKANEFVTDMGKRALMQRGVEGVVEPVYQGGKKVGHVRRYSDRCLELMLKSRDKSFRGLDDVNQTEILRAVDEIVSRVTLAINKRLPQTCPHCKSLLNLRTEIVDELARVSASMGMPTS